MSKKHDPFASREAEKYVHPIPSRELILATLKERGYLATRDDLAELLHLDDPRDIVAFKRRLKAMLRDAQLERLRGGYFWPSDATTLVQGKIVSTGKRNKYYSLIPEDNSEPIMITSLSGMTVYHDDVAVVAVADIVLTDPTEREGRLVEIIEQQRIVVTGRLVLDDDSAYVVPFGRKILQDIIIETLPKTAVANSIVVAEITKHASRFAPPLGKIITVLGEESQHGIEIAAAIENFELPDKFPAKVKQQAKAIPKDISDEALRDRLDLRELPLVTIDGSDAKDFDDAVFCEAITAGGWHLYVAIADVGYYVHPDSAIDKEAQLRGNSIYFPEKVISMLPKVLADDLCSLLPNIDRLCLVCKITFSKAGKINCYKFYDGIMRSHARLTYEDVQNILDGGNKKLLQQHQELLPHITELYNLYLALEHAREIRGAIDFATTETKIVFGDNGKIADIVPTTRLLSHRIIEECMLAANVCAAKLLIKHKVPAIYRNHEPPSAEKLEEVKKFLAALGLSFRDHSYTNVLQQVAGRKDFNIIQTVLLRSLSQAKYEVNNVGHFGLSFDAYCHFTSPIRRYPDLIVHRQIRNIIRDRLPQARAIELALPEIAANSSMTERRADEATRDVVTWLKCQYMQQHLGEIFKGVISGVINFGFFVELQDIYIDGMVHVSMLKDDFYVYDAVHHKLSGERAGTVYALGDQVVVKLVKVDVDNRRIDLAVITESTATKKTKKPKRKTKRYKK